MLSTREKALNINLDRTIYGSFAEIGAGQEVAANFFKAGGSSGTVAQTISAYDMQFSDTLYGKAERYVCEERLETMLSTEFNKLNNILKGRSSESKFFAFANTVEALNYYRTNNGHGWLGLKFQLSPDSEPNECIIHMVMFDNDNLSQQEAVGIVGVNLIYAAYFHHNDPDKFIDSLMDGLNPGRVEIDMFKLTGPDFDHVDNRLMALKLVKSGLTDAAMFGPDGGVLQASQALYKKNILVLRGRFRPLTKVNLDMLNHGLEMFKQEEGVDPENLRVIFELTLKDLSAEGGIKDKDFLDRVDILCSLGHTVMISNYHKYYTLVTYLANSVRDRKIGVILGIFNLMQVFDDKYYDLLKGRLLESFGRLFGRNVKLYVYPALNPSNGQLITTDNFEIDPKLKHLLLYLKENNKIADIKNINPDNLHIFSDDVLRMIKENENGWEVCVPPLVANTIKEKELFGFQENAASLK